MYCWSLNRYLLLLNSCSIVTSLVVVPTTAPAKDHLHPDSHEWFTEVLHEVEMGELKISSDHDDSWIHHNFHSSSPYSYFSGENSPLRPTSIPEQEQQTFQEEPQQLLSDTGNEWMTYAIRSSHDHVLAPTSSHSRGTEPPSFSDRSDGFVDVLDEIPPSLHLPATTTTTTTTGSNANPNRPMTVGRADWFGTVLSDVESKHYSLTPTKHLSRGTSVVDSRHRSTTTSADWFFQALSPVITES